MRAILLLLILAVVALIAAISTGFLDIEQTQSAEVPRISASENGVTATGGQPPAFDVETGNVAIGSEPRQVTVPLPNVRVNPADAGQPRNAPAGANEAATTNTTQP